MTRSFPVQELPNGKHIYQDPQGTFSHQHPTSGCWCEQHKTADEAWECYKSQERGEDVSPPRG